MKKFLLSLAVAMLVIPVAVIFAGCSGSSVDYDKIKEAVNNATLNVNVNQNYDDLINALKNANTSLEDVNPLLGVWSSTKELNDQTPHVFIFANDNVFLGAETVESDIAPGYDTITVIGSWSVEGNEVTMQYYGEQEDTLIATMTFSNNNKTLTLTLHGNENEEIEGIIFLFRM